MSVDTSSPGGRSEGPSRPSGFRSVGAGFDRRFRGGGRTGGMVTQGFRTGQGHFPGGAAWADVPRGTVRAGRGDRSTWNVSNAEYGMRNAEWKTRSAFHSAFRIPHWEG